MPRELYSLAYFSRNCIRGTPDDVEAGIRQILASARRNNARVGVTGALLFSDGCFAQVLEGAREDIEAVFENIECDPRHSEVTILHLHPIPERSFGQWSMAFAGIDGVSIDPGIVADGMSTPAGIADESRHAHFIEVLRDYVYRDEKARAGAADAAATNPS